MRTNLLLTILCFTIVSTYSQSCIGTNQLTLLGKKGSGIFHQLQMTNLSYSNSDPSQTEIYSGAWTCNSMGYPICNFRSIIKYKLSQIPPNSLIASAKLYLYARTNSTNAISGSPTYGTDNAVSISRVVTPWDTSGVGFGWNNKPLTTDENQVTLPSSSSNTQDYVADLQNLVQFWVSNPDSNFGMAMKVINETYYKSMIFHSGTSVDAVKPRLEICYWTEEQFPKVFGYTYYDANSNDLKDSSEYPAPYTKIQLSNGTFTFSDVNGYYEISSNTLGYYTIDVTAPNFYTASNLTSNYNFTNFGQVFQSNIPFVATSNTDSINVHIIPFHSFARPGFAFPCYVDYENLGNTVLNPTIGVDYDGLKQTYDSCSEPSFYNNGNVFGGLTSSINPGERHYFIGYLTTKPTISLVDTLQLDAFALAGTAIATDAVSVPVRASFDPNDKEATAVLSPLQIAAGKYIDYTIRFENVGNDTAFNIVINDTLSNLLQANTLQIISSSHTCKATVIGKFVKFEFKNIKLLYHSLNELKSIGFVKFRVKPLTTITNGTTINNKASIYFDFNEPILTNTAITKISSIVVTPVKISKYEVRSKISSGKQKQVLNFWTTLTELNTSHFNIQRSTDGNQFITIGKVIAKGVGNYEFADNQLPPMAEDKPLIIYYKLEIIDKDGSKAYSTVQQITIKQSHNTTLFPNPANNEITVERKSSTKEKISIIDASGKTMLMTQLNSQIQSINISSLSNGVYIVSFESGDKMKLIKN